ncbi:hypothetical protein Q4F19_02370 [Sphingomonas sp. BIUV-7]|uniref:Uncharacterized protein n=1 Tax=Sphingomonas natans TaxID=3063330 RepID=A0ABT8Y5N6_9SPHN|nr:hypothetical protein [Sphingomonas sp. BIUV-7]MDO6413218.1 hypothetical protein [Sphingomonas sp. BIUV-7]
MILTAARRLHWRLLLVASALFVGIALLFATHLTETPQTMIAASRAALMVGLLGLRMVASGVSDEASTDGD